MKRDLHHLMDERGLDAIVVSGKMLGNSALQYMVNGANIGGGYVIQKRGQEPILICSPIEREEAAASGLSIVNMSHYKFSEVLREHDDRLAAQVELYRRIFADLEVQGRVGFYGMADPGGAWQLLNALDAQLEGIKVYGDFDVTVIDEARATKDAEEVERIREVGRRTAQIVKQTVEFLTAHAVKDEVLVQADGSSLTIGRVHEEITRLIAIQGLEDPEGFIFAIGRDAGVPHNRGNPEALLRLGQTIVYDIFPRQAGGGYFFDMTRTFCLGYASPEVEQAYRDVYECMTAMIEAYQVGEPTRRYQQMTCAFLEERGHPTVGTDDSTEEGYVHSLGHGVGLAIHEEPRFSDLPSNTDVLRPGHVFTCEPGVYYPSRGYGIRLEDVLWVTEDGAIQNLTDYPKELVIPL